MEHANKMKGKDIVAWITAVESTENLALIKQALDEFWKLPDFDDKKKQEMLKRLIESGYTGLKLNDKNP